jgi:hypothetical protein
VNAEQSYCLRNGHRFETPTISGDCLYFCAHCGSEMFGRTFDDIEPISPERLEEIHAEAECFA